MKPSVVVWDLETVPDLAGFAAANDLVGKSDVEVREALGDKFPKHIYHSIVCIGALIAHREPDIARGETVYRSELALPQAVLGVRLAAGESHPLAMGSGLINPTIIDQVLTALRSSSAISFVTFQFSSLSHWSASSMSALAKEN